MTPDTYTSANMETAMYMAFGANTALEKLPRKPYTDFTDRFGGHTGIMAELIPLAKYADEVYDALAVDHDTPGVFQYEIAEPFGAWWVGKGCPDADAAQQYIKATIEEWMK